MGVREFGKTRSACNTFMMLQRLAGEWYRESVRLKGKQRQEERNLKARGTKGTKGEKRQKRDTERKGE